MICHQYKFEFFKEKILNEITQNMTELTEHREIISLLLFIINGDFDREFYHKNSNKITEGVKKFLTRNSEGVITKNHEEKLGAIRDVIFTTKSISKLFENREKFQEKCFNGAQFCVLIGLVFKRLLNDESFENTVDIFIDILESNTQSL